MKTFLFGNRQTLTILEEKIILELSLSLLLGPLPNHFVKSLVPILIFTAVTIVFEAEIDQHVQLFIDYILIQTAERCEDEEEIVIDPAGGQEPAEEL